MARKKRRQSNQLPHFRAREQKSGRIYYYLDTGGKPRKEIPLGPDLHEALRKYAELRERGWEPPKEMGCTFRQVAERYMAEVVPLKARNTQRGNVLEMERLLAFFDNPPARLDMITPRHIQGYLEFRHEARTRANREKALFSHVFNKARQWGYTNAPNPCLGIRSFRETGRTIYIEDDVYQAVHAQGCDELRDAMDLAYLTGQRPSDVTGFTELDLVKDRLAVDQGKTGTKLDIRLNDSTGNRNSLGVLIDRLLANKAKHSRPTTNLLCVASGQPLTLDILRKRFVKARKLAAKEAVDMARAASEPRERARLQALAESIKAFQFRDLRAKAGTDTAAKTGSMKNAQNQLGHASGSMTEHYVRRRRGETVDPTK